MKLLALLLHDPSPQAAARWSSATIIVLQNTEAVGSSHALVNATPIISIHK
jgi:hypothetical protein